VDSTRWSVEDEDGRTVNPTDNPAFASVLSRRALLQGAAAGMVVVTAGGLRGARGAAAQPATGFASVAASSEDKVIVPPGYRSTVVLRWGDPLFPGAPEFDPTAQTAAKQERQFGYDNDFIGFMPLPMGSDSSTRGLLGVNHENARSELFWPGWDGKHESKTRAMVETEIAAHGFTVVEIARAADGSWSIVKGSPYNRRITGATPMAIRGPAAGSPLVRTKADPAGTQALGTLNNCAGGFTPWGTFLTGEENIQNYFRGKLDVVPDAGLQAIHKRYGIGTDRGRYMTWGRDHERFDLAREPNEPNRFGWVVEIDPYDPGSMPIKHTALGRMAHEGATVIVARDGRPVTYMGDDARFEYLYKFVAAGRIDAANRQANLQLLDSGILYVARFRDDGSGEWLPLVHGQGPLTEANGFRSQAEIAVNTRRAADLLGATRMDRPEDVEPNWKTGKVYAVMTGNESRARPGGPGQPAGRREVRTHRRADRGRRRSHGHALSLGDAPPGRRPQERRPRGLLPGPHRRGSVRDAGQHRVRRRRADVGGDRRERRDARSERRRVDGRDGGLRAGTGPAVSLEPDRLRGLRPGLHPRQPDLLRGDPASGPDGQGHVRAAGQPLSRLPRRHAAAPERHRDPPRRRREGRHLATHT